MVRAKEVALDMIRDNDTVIAYVVCLNKCRTQINLRSLMGPTGAGKSTVRKDVPGWSTISPLI
jgi:Fe-S cluster assembly ATPase SufC